MKNKISTQAARLKKIRLYLGMTRTEFSMAMEISQFTIRSWEIGYKNFNSKSIKRVIQALKTNLNFECDYNWLESGIGKSPISLHEESSTISVNKLNVSNKHEQLMYEISIFKNSHLGSEIIRVMDDFFNPLAEAGDYLGFNPISLRSIKRYIGKIILIQLVDDNKLFGELLYSNNKYNLRNFSNNQLQDLNFDYIKSTYSFIWFRKNI